MSWAACPRHLGCLKDYGVKIITGDRDLLQLVDERILVNLPGKISGGC